MIKRPQESLRSVKGGKCNIKSVFFVELGTCKVDSLLLVFDAHIKRLRVMFDDRIGVVWKSGNAKLRAEHKILLWD